MSSDQRRQARSSRRLIVVGAAWLVMTAVAILGAIALDDPAGEGPRDAARPIVAGPIVGAGEELTGRDDGLPPLGLVLGTPLSANLRDLPVAQRAQELRKIAATSADPRRLLELGVTYQQLSDTPAAREAYRDALRLDPDNVPARVGLAMADAATGTEGQAAAGQTLAALEKEAPRSQIVAFNRGWLDIYRRRPRPALASLKRAVRLGSETSLGQTAQRLVDAIENPPAIGEPPTRDPSG